MLIEPLRLIGWALLVFSIPIIKKAYERLVEQQEKEAPDLNIIFTSKLTGRAGIFFFLSGLVLIVNGGDLYG